MPCNGYGNCGQPTEKRFMGKEYCWDCWLDLKHEHQDWEPRPKVDRESGYINWEDEDDEE